MSVLDNEHCLVVMKNESINVADVATSIELMADAKCHIDSGKKEILTAIARQIIVHRKAGCRDVRITREVRRWAQVLHSFFFVENSRNKEREVSVDSIETEIFKIVSELYNE